MGTRFKVEGIFTARDHLTRKINEMSGSVSRFTDTGYRGFMDLRSMAGHFQNAIVAVGAAAVAAMAGVALAIRDVIESGMDFESAMANVASKFGAPRATEDFRLLEAAALEAASTTEFSAVEAARALAELGAAGTSAGDAIVSLPTIINTATAAGIELGAASDIITDQLTAFGLATSDSTQLGINLARVSDVMARGANVTSQSFEQLTGALSNVAASANSAGLDIETTTALIGALADQGEKGDRAGTRLDAMLRNLREPTRDAARALRSLHVDTRNADGSLRDALDIVRDFETGLAGMNDEARDRALGRIFNEQGLRPMNLLLQTGSTRLEDLRTQLRNADGAAAETAATMRDTAEGDMAALTAAIDATKIALYELIREPFRELLKGMGDWVRANREVITSGITDTVEWLSENTWLVYGVLLAVAFVLAIIAGLAGIVALAVIVMMAPFIALGAVIFGIVALFDWLSETVPPILDDIGDAMSAVWDDITGAFSAAGAFIGGVLSDIGDFFVDLWQQTIRPVFVGLLEFFTGLWVMAYNALRVGLIEPTMENVDTLVGWFMAVWEPVSDFFVELFATITTVASTGWGLILAGVQSAVARVRAFWEPIGGFFSGLWEGVKNTAFAVWQGIVDRVTGIVGEIKALWKPIGAFFSNLWRTIVERFTNEFSTVVGTIEGVVNFVRGVGAEELAGPGEGGQAITPAERVAHTVSESRSIQRSEVTINDRTGRAEITQPPRGGLVNLELQRSGGFPR